MQKLSFQELILRLIDFWIEHGCLVQQPYNVQVGAGTMNPATALRVLGPEPWRVVYVEPSVRPDDGRYGDNPNRMQLFHQLQVILKPDPGNPQEIYLESLEAIGIDPQKHDIRFVEDNWQHPAMGAWGLGWEVWLDGQEITQYTYFQQAGGQDLDPVSVELTYGLDRIALALQGVDSVWELDYGQGIPYGDLLLQSEIEHSRYYIDVADVEAIRGVYDTYEKEAIRCLAAGLVIPAHDYNLKCSHLFNVLDTRGAVGVTERANYFRRMRRMSLQISEQYLEQRQRLEFPFSQVWPADSEPIEEAVVEFTERKDPQAFLLEIGSEELPADDLTAAIHQLEGMVPELLAQLRLDYEKVVVNGTPRRVAITVERLAGRQTDVETMVNGPPADRAFDAEGNPTRAAMGFARSRGVDLADLKVVEEKEKRYVAAVVREEGRPAVAVLAEALPDLIAGIKFDKSMRWNETAVAYSRPLRWLVALSGPDVIPFSYAGLTSGRVSRGLRSVRSPDIQLEDAAQYAGTMLEHGIITDVQKRREIIVATGRNLAAEIGGIIPEDAALLEEVANLVESPTVLRGRFDERFLTLPDEVLVAVMRKHQRYFPVYADSGRLLPYFVAVRNGDERHLNIVIEGNEHVLRARFADAEFFYNNDVKRDLGDMVAKLDKLTFQSDLGSMLAKMLRLERLTPTIAQMLGLNADETAAATRAAALSKADLASKMVVEMTSLQGIMGGHYARLAGEPQAVAAAIAEQYENVAETRPGLALALADRLDSLAGLFAVGLAPRGSNDPFGLRRAALSIIENLIASEMDFDLRVALQAAASLLPEAHRSGDQAMVLEFVGRRLESRLRDEGFPASIVKAVLAEQGYDPYGSLRSVVALSDMVRAPDWEKLLDAYARCVRIIRGLDEQYVLRSADFTNAAEISLLQAYGEATSRADGTIATFVNSIRHMEPAITAFFEEVLVMDDDRAVRENRLALMQHIAALAKGIADFSHLEGF